MSKDYYGILGVAKTASKEDIKKAYRHAAFKHHPDRNPGDKEAENRFKEASEAYEVLVDQDKRRRYDGTGGEDQDFFSSFHFDFSSHRSSKDVRVDVTLTLEESILGCDRKIKVPRLEKCTTCGGNGAATLQACEKCGGTGILVLQDRPFVLRATCPACRGNGTVPLTACDTCKGIGRQGLPEEEINVTLPPGVDQGMAVVVPGKGQDGANLYVVVSITPHDIFTRNGIDLLVKYPVTYTQLVFGDSIEIPTPTGLAIVRIPSRAKPGSKLKIAGKGVRHISDRMTGDLIVFLDLEIPKEMSPEYREILEKLRELENKPSE